MLRAHHVVLAIEDSQRSDDPEQLLEKRNYRTVRLGRKLLELTRQVDETPCQKIEYLFLRRDTLSQVIGFIRELQPETLRFAYKSLGILDRITAMTKTDLIDNPKDALAQIRELTMDADKLVKKYDCALDMSSHDISEIRDDMLERKAIEMKTKRKLGKFRSIVLGSFLSVVAAVGKKKNSRGPQSEDSHLDLVIDSIEVIADLKETFSCALRDYKDPLSGITDDFEIIAENVELAQWHPRRAGDYLVKISSMAEKRIKQIEHYVLGIEDDQRVLTTCCVESGLTLRDTYRYRLNMKKVKE